MMATLSETIKTPKLKFFCCRNIASGAGNTSARVAGVLAPQVGLLVSA
jgi:hypothetical protein